VAWLTKDELIESLLKRISEQDSLLQSLSDSMNQQLIMLAQQTTTIEQLSQTIKELNEKLGKNSKNSSKPPASDGLKKPVTKSLRQSSGKKAGAQQGHTGTHLAMISNPDHIEQHLPNACEGCPNQSKCMEQRACITEKRHVIDAVVTVHVTEHQRIEVTDCPYHIGQKLSGNFPTDVLATVQYGTNLKALAVALNTVGMVSVNRTHEILGSVFNIPISTGTISSMVTKCAASVADTVIAIRQKVINSVLVHFDETGTRVEGKTMWVHNSSTEEYTYLSVHQKRGTDGMDDNGVLPVYQGIAMHDCWKSYWKYEAAHAVCCAHLLRELTGIEENYPEQTWAKKFKYLLLEMKKIKDKAVLADKSELSAYHLHKFDIEYDAILQEAIEINPLPIVTEVKRGRKKKGKILALVGRLAEYKASICLFIKNFAVPFDNNQAERDIRMIKVKTKVSGCFRSKEGADDFLKIMSYVGTARKQKLNSYEAIRNAIVGNPDFILT
jgi:transposase